MTFQDSFAWVQYIQLVKSCLVFGKVEPAQWQCPAISFYFDFLLSPTPPLCLKNLTTILQNTPIFQRGLSAIDLLDTLNFLDSLDESTALKAALDILGIVLPADNTIAQVSV